MEGKDIAFVGAIASLVFSAFTEAAAGLIDDGRLSVVLDSHTLTADEARTGTIGGMLGALVLFALAGSLSLRDRAQ